MTRLFPFPALTSFAEGKSPMEGTFRSAAVVVLVAVGFVVLLPAALLLAAAYYLVALLQGSWSLLRVLTGQKPPPPAEPLQGPHCWVLEEPAEPPGSASAP